MNYQLHYDRLIERSKHRVLTEYSERHHIIPRCLGGTDDKSNIAVLTAEEHFVAHQLLVKMYPGNRDLVYATQLMTIHHTDSRVNNKLFGWLRRRMSSAMSIQMKEWIKKNGHRKGMKDKTHTEDVKNQISASQKIAMTEAVGVRVYVYDLDGKFEQEFRTLTDCANAIGSTAINVKMTAEGKHGHCKQKQIRYTFSERIDAYVKPSPLKGKKKTEEHKKNQSISMSGRSRTKEWIEQHSKDMKAYHARKKKESV